MRLPSLRLVFVLFCSSSMVASTVTAEARCRVDGLDPALVERAGALLETHPLIDGHNDLPWALRDQVRGQLSKIDLHADLSSGENATHTDLGRLRSGGVGAQFWSVWVPVSLDGPEAVLTVIEQIDLVHRMVERYPDRLGLARSAEDVVRLHDEGKVASLIGIEGGHSIGGSLAVLRQLHAIGARYMTLTHWRFNEWADAATSAPRFGGLGAFGREVVREMNRLGMIVDLSHVSTEAMHDALDETGAPVVFSHSSARGVTDHPRNVPDDVLRRLPDNGGVVMITFVPSFVSEDVRQYGAARAAEQARLETLHIGDPKGAAAALEAWENAHPLPRATLAQVADHIDHVRDVAGIEHVGIGGDYDGISTVPAGLEDVSCYPTLFAELLRRGYTEDQLAMIAGGNVLRVMRGVEEAAKARGSEPANEALLEDFEAPPVPDEAS